MIEETPRAEQACPHCDFRVRCTGGNAQLAADRELARHLKDKHGTGPLSRKEGGPRPERHWEHFACRDCWRKLNIGKPEPPMAHWPKAACCWCTEVTTSYIPMRMDPMITPCSVRAKNAEIERL